MYRTRTYTITKIILIILITLAVSVFVPAKAIQAQNQGDTPSQEDPAGEGSDIPSESDERTEHQIDFYDPSSTVCATGASGNETIGNNEDYAGNPVWTDEELALIEEHRSTYEEAAKDQDVPWQMLAVIHKRENSLRLDYNSNQQGIYQFYEDAGDYPGSGTASPEEFLSQSIELARQLQNDYVTRNHPDNKGPLSASGTEDNVIQDTFFSYNGRAQVYANQASSLGFPTPEQAFQGSPYVMNKADADRDPNENPNSWGQVKVDGGGIEYPANQDYGAWVYYAALAGGTGCSTSGDTFIMEIEGDQYAWPVSPARQSENGGVSGMSALPCNSRSCHHDGSPAFDISRQPGGREVVGTPVYAITDGEIQLRNDDYDGIPGCQSVQLVSSADQTGSSRWWYWYGHIQGVEKSDGDPVKVGEQIGHIGELQCARNSVEHLHIDRGDPQGVAGGSVSHRNSGMIEIINTLFNNMPE